MPSLTDRLLDATLLGYTKLGYAHRVKGSEEALPRMEGRTVVVTGATSGLGEAAAFALAGLGASVIAVGRSEEKLAATRQRIHQATGLDVETERADLALVRDVAALAERLARRPAIHVLVNNAGVLSNERHETAEGVELTFATNLLGHYVLTERLIPTLARSAPARIVNVSSGGMYTQRIRVDDLETTQLRYDGPSAYARTKRGQVILTELWAERLRTEGVVVHAMHPGWADTPGVRESLPRFQALTRRWLRDSAEGADTIVWLAAADEPARSSGLFFHDRAPRPTHRFPWTRERPGDREALVEALEARARALLLSPCAFGCEPA